jgi:hypothetical protein
LQFGGIKRDGIGVLLYRDVKALATAYRALVKIRLYRKPHVAYREQKRRGIVRPAAGELEPLPAVFAFKHMYAC